MPADSARVDEIFGHALTKADAAERRAYLDEACAGDASVRDHVEALLAAHVTAAPRADDTVATLVLVTERPGAKIGRYKLLEQIGEGGMGAVFLAEQKEPVRRRVALKVIKAGMDTRRVVARFEAERQALAMMDHPNIARVFDGGATDAGQPYFVMELVKGTPITEYCDKDRLAVRQRLELFCQVADAVQHAHQKGLIHRDIKPTNVLVTAQDDRPAAKVIDFGVAKAVGARLTEKTLFTELHQLIGTPAYMSPEQAEGGMDIDTRSDVYSLGVLLYELVAGAPPFDPTELGSKSFAEMLRIIREVEPVTPSARLSELEGRLPTVAAERSTDPRRLSESVRGELDWIVMRCLEKDRKRRYQTASDLADDVRRYLADQPVEARPATRTYRLRKFVRRNKAAVVAGSAVVAALAAGLALAAAGFIQARRQAAIAQAEAQQSALMTQRATAVQDFLRGMLVSANPEAQAGGAATVEEMLDRAGQKLDDSLEPEVRAVLHETIGETFYGLQLYEDARRHHQAAVDLRRCYLNDLKLPLANVLSLLAKTEIVMGVNNDATVANCREAVKILSAAVPEDDWRLVYARGLESHAAGKSADRVLVDQAVQVLTHMTEEQVAGLKVSGEYGRTIAQVKKLLTAKNEAGATAVMLRYHLANMEKVNRMVAAGDVAGIQKNTVEHLGPFLEVPLVGDNTPGGTIVLAKMMKSQGFAPAMVEATLRAAIEMARMLGEDRQRTYIAVGLHDLAEHLVGQDRLADAEKECRAALEVRRKWLGPENPETVKSLELLNSILKRAGKPPETAPRANDAASKHAAER
jgi:hypothetical protein